MQALRGVSRQDGDLRLQDRRSGVHSAVHVMDRTAGFLHSGFQCLFPCLQAGEGGQQGRVNIDDPVRERLQQRLSHQPHETREAYQIDPGGFQRGGGFGLGLLRILRLEAAAVDDAGGNPGFLRPLQDVALRIVRKDEGDFGGDRSVGDPVQDRLHVRAGTGAEDTEAHGGRREAELPELARDG